MDVSIKVTVTSQEDLKRLIDTGLTLLNKKELLLEFCKKGRTDLVKVLLDDGVDVNFRDYDTTPLIVACRKFNIDLVDLLLDYGADVNFETRKNTPLTAVCYRSYYSTNMQVKIIKRLLNAGAKKSTKVYREDWSGHRGKYMTALEIAIEEKLEEDIVKLL